MSRSSSDDEQGDVISDTSYTQEQQKILQVLSNCQAIGDALKNLEKKINIINGKVTKLHRVHVKSLWQSRKPFGYAFKYYRKLLARKMRLQELKRKALSPSRFSHSESYSPTVPVESYSPTVPVESYSPTVPVESYSPTEPVESYSPTEPVESYSPTEPVESYSPTEPVESYSPTVPVESYSPTVSVESYSPTLPVESYSPTLPVESYSPTEPVESYSPTVPVESYSPTEPVESYSPTEPVESYSPTEPVESYSPTEPVESYSPTEPVESYSPTEPVESYSPTEPVESYSPTEPVESYSPTVPVESSSPTVSDSDYYANAVGLSYEVEDILAQREEELYTNQDLSLSQSLSNHSGIFPQSYEPYFTPDSPTQSYLPMPNFSSVGSQDANSIFSSAEAGTVSSTEIIAQDGPSAVHSSETITYPPLLENKSLRCTTTAVCIPTSFSTTTLVGTDLDILKQRCSGDPSAWSVEEVILFLKAMEPDMLPYFDDIFRRHEIDGQALLLLNSDMMIKHMGLKLGTAMKLYHHIEKLKREKYINH